MSELSEDEKELFGDGGGYVATVDKKLAPCCADMDIEAYEKVYYRGQPEEEDGKQVIYLGDSNSDGMEEYRCVNCDTILSDEWMEKIEWC